MVAEAEDNDQNDTRISAEGIWTDAGTIHKDGSAGRGARMEVLDTLILLRCPWIS